ncbi:hypothetical protein AAEO56_07045 [Flavobacterium sp. DGU11]|uniref:Lantibiotic dehydratase, C terminus n=1 Tax=Flavobacterium arundinis TaxID=3139143 RepID=A0ABU9HV25_9FLAO
MVQIKLRLSFQNIFPEEAPEDVLSYLGQVSIESLLKVIGFCNTLPLPNYHNFFSNPDVAAEIRRRVSRYRYENRIADEPVVMSPEGALRIAEIILSNRELLIENNANASPDADEINLFKAFLLINDGLNGRQVIDEASEGNFEKLVDYCITFSFPLADLAVYENNDREFAKLIYATIKKVEYLFAFLSSSAEYEGLRQGLMESYGVGSQEDFFREMKYLFAKLFTIKVQNDYLFQVEDENTLRFLNSLVNENLQEDEDYTNIKNSPLYRLEDDLFSVINYFFVVDKFYRSSKFKIKELYESDAALVAKYGNFFSFFNKHFSENFLMKQLLDDIFGKKYFFRKEEREAELPREPDYYVRYQNDVYIFENKDVMIAKAVKASADITQINTVFKAKFQKEGNRPVGIGQLVTTILEMSEGEFRFDDYVNSKKHLTIYPILLIHDRIFQSLGINYRLNTWFKEEISERFGDKPVPFNVKSLTILDINTLVVWRPHLKAKDRNFKDVLNLHLEKMNRIKKVNTPDQRLGLYRVQKNLGEQLAPLGDRPVPFGFDVKGFINNFIDILPERDDAELGEITD